MLRARARLHFVCYYHDYAIALHSAHNFHTHMLSCVFRVNAAGARVRECMHSRKDNNAKDGR